MGQIKGQRPYERFIKGEKLTRRQAMLAKCYECNGFEESNADCLADNCPLYPYHAHRGKNKS